MSDKMLQDLNKMYTDGETADKSLYAEMRSNLLLISGDHYIKRNWKALQSLRDNSSINEEQKIRIMKNHTNKIFKGYVNRLVSAAPGTKIKPNNEKEPQDQKAAEMHSAVWAFTKKQIEFPELRTQFAEDYVGIGEVWVRIAWDWDKGYLKKQEPIMEEVTLEDGTVETRDTGKKNNYFSGGIDAKRIFGFNVFRPKNCQDVKKAPWLGIRYMESIEDLQEMHPKLKDKIKEDSQQAFLVFDVNTSEYATTKDQILVKEVYYRPNPKYPKGYFYKYINATILDEGELPAGVFPLRFAGFDAIPTHPRYNSPVKQWKPYQVEINRMSSKMAEHQVTLGDDKVIIQNGGKLSHGGNYPGIRALSATGGAVSVVSGRTGEQYLNVLSSTITEYYQNAMVPEDAESASITGQVDPYALLMTLSKWRTRFATHIERFERFLVEVTEVCLELTRYYIEDDELIQAIGKHEQINIPEYKKAQALGYQITLEEASDDMESRIGRKLSMDRYIQYAGANMTKEDIGKFIRLDPYLNKEQLFSDYTMAYDNATNDILALDRGQMPVMSKYRYPQVEYILQRLSNRMGQADFQYLEPKIQQMYEQVMQQYQQILTQAVQEQAALNADMIPTDGPLVRTDFWVPSKKDPLKQERLALPNSTLIWIWDRVQKQGMTMDVLQQQQQAVVSDVARSMKASQPQQQPSQEQGTLPPYMQRFLGAINK